MVCCFGFGGGLCVLLVFTPSTRRVPHAIDATRLSQRDAGHARWRRRLRGEALRHFDGRPGPGLLHVRGDALDLRLPHLYAIAATLKKDAGSRTRGENVHCLISCAYSMGALGMPMVFGFREEAVGLRWTLVGLLGGGV